MAESKAGEPRPSVLTRFFEAQGGTVVRGLSDLGGVVLMTGHAFRALVTTRFEPRALIYQMEQMGVRSFAIAAATGIFVGIVMSIQFASALERYGARDTIGRIVGLSEARELAPSLTALVVGCRIGAGIAAELGSMAVTEQIDAIRALGADPVRKLVIPRMLACMIVMPLLAIFAFILGLYSAALVSRATFGLSVDYFIRSAFDSVWISDFVSGLAKTPFFGLLISVIGCYYGMTTRGGTEGVGRATTTAVVTVAISVLVADAVLTQLFLQLFLV